MTDAELVQRLRAIAEPVGPLHALWDIIFDLEAKAVGKQTLLPLKEVELMASTLKMHFHAQDYMDVSAKVERDFYPAIAKLIDQGT